MAHNLAYLDCQVPPGARAAGVSAQYGDGDLIRLSVPGLSSPARPWLDRLVCRVVSRAGMGLRKAACRPGCRECRT